MKRQSTILSKYNIQNINVIALAFSASIFILCQPYFTWYAALFNKLILFLIIFLSIVYVRRIKTNDIFIILLFLIFISYISFLSSKNVLGFVVSYSPIFILLMKKEKVLFS